MQFTDIWLRPARLWRRLVLVPGLRYQIVSVSFIFLLSRFVFYMAAFFGSAVFPEAVNEPAMLSVNSTRAIALHWRWDAIHYYTLSNDGYQPGGGTAFFPLFPILIRVVATVLGGFRAPLAKPIGEAEQAPLVAGILIAQVAAYIAFWLIFTLAREESGDEATAYRATLYTAFFPLAFYYNVPYTEPVFLALSLATFLAARRHSWITAGLCAGLASATRLAGSFLAPVLLLEIAMAYRRGKIYGRAKIRALFGLLLAPAGLCLFAFHLWWLTGDPLAFVNQQSSAWAHELLFPLVTIARGLYYAVDPSRSATLDLYARGVLHTAIVLGFLAVSFWSARRWRPSYVLYAVLTFLVILSSVWPGERVMHSSGRYIMMVFPVYITLAQWGRYPTFHTVVTTTWLPLYGLLTALYARWYPVS